MTWAAAQVVRPLPELETTAVGGGLWWGRNDEFMYDWSFVCGRWVGSETNWRGNQESEQAEPCGPCWQVTLEPPKNLCRDNGKKKWREKKKNTVGREC